MTLIAIHRVRTAPGGPLEPVGVWTARGGTASGFYPEQHSKYLERGRKVIRERPTESAEAWLQYKAATSPNWELHGRNGEASFDTPESDPAKIYEAARGVFDAQVEVGRGGVAEATRPPVRTEPATPGSWGAHRFAIAQSWWIASELVRRHPELVVYEMHQEADSTTCSASQPPTSFQLPRFDGTLASC